MPSLMNAQLIWDGGEVRIPSEMGTPKPDQMQGTPAEQLAELAGRCCYDSLGTGRPSFDCEKDGKPVEGYHTHITKVGHGSVREHYTFTILFAKLEPEVQSALFEACANRPGVLVLEDQQAAGLRVTLNLLAVNEWMKWAYAFYGDTAQVIVAHAIIGEVIRRLAYPLAPSIVTSTPFITNDEMTPAQMTLFVYAGGNKIVPPANDHERWISLYMSGSRGFSHELVRHGNFTAISQRSTRFVDEDGSPWVEHPLITHWRSQIVDGLAKDGVSQHLQELKQLGQSEFAEKLVFKAAREAYAITADLLEKFLRANKVDATSARKQARGAARGYLGNALHTSLVFSASVHQWKHMLRQRASQFADAEIREVFCTALGVLKASRYGESFEGFRLEKSPDGIGMVGVERA
jgi:hypothetical protein